jgi:hypothetical protein
MAEALQFEKVDKDGNPNKRYLGSTSCKPQKAKKPCIDTDLTATLSSLVKDNHNFECPKESKSDSTSGNNLDGILPSNAEVFHFIN